MPLLASEPEFNRRYVTMLSLMVLVFVLFSGRLYCLQVTHGEEHEALSRANFVDVRRDVALRGMIFDRNGRLLADNRPSFNLYFTPAYCKREAFETTLTRLTEYVSLRILEIDRIKDVFETTKRLDRWLPLLVRRKLSREELAAVEQNLGRLEGVEIRPETRRAYPLGKFAAHLLGYVGEISRFELDRLVDDNYRQGDIIGKSGLEVAWENVLRGENGELHVVVDSRKQRVPEKLAAQVLKQLEPVVPATAGDNLVLSIDARLQALAEERFPGIEGAVVAVEPSTGFILTMMSKPAFDPSEISGRIQARDWQELIRDPDKPLTNRATQQQFPPGSTFKPFTGFAALATEDWDENTRQLCTGRIHFGGHVFRCWRHGGHGDLALHRAITQSCDVYFYRAGYAAGQDMLARVSQDFGFGSATGFDAGQEVPGIMPDRDWYKKHTRTGFLPGFTISNSIGQGDVNVTPLQLALAYATIANGGTLYRPQVVIRIESPTGKVVRTFSPQARRQVKVPEEQLKIMAEALAGVVNEPGGTGYYRRPRKVEFQVAGKTGTAQVVKQGEERGKGLPYDFRDHAWFAAWAPVDNPKIAVAVVNEHGGHGSSGAAPIAMELITYYLEQIEKETVLPEGDGS